MAAIELSDEPWSNFSQADYADAGALCDASLINMNVGPRTGWTKGNCKLPVREPDGDLNRNGMAAAAAALAGARGPIDASAAAKGAAARTLVGHYRSAGETPPDSLVRMAG